MTIDPDFLSGGAAAPEPDFASVIAAKFAENQSSDTPPAKTAGEEAEPVKTDDAAPVTDEPAATDTDTGDWWKSLSKEEVESLRNNKAGRSFDAIKKEAKAAKAELERLQAELDRYKDVNLDEITTLKTKYQSQEAKIAAVRLEETERYDTEIRRPLARVVQELDKLGGDELIQILNETDPKERDAKLSAFLDTAPSYTAKKVERFFSEFEELADKQATMRTNAVEELKKAEEEQGRRTSEMTAKQRATYEAKVDEVFDILARHNLPPELLAEKLRGAIKSQDIAKMDPLTQAFAVAGTELVPKLTGLLKTRDQEIKSLKETVARLQGASPGPGSKPGTAVANDNLSFSEAIAARMAQRSS